MPASFSCRFPALARGVARLLGAVALAGLVACGGASRVEPFAPSQGVVFGDETSLVLPDGRKYGVNYVDAGTPNCGLYPVWSQYALASFGLVFAECNPDGLAVTAQMRAAAGARVADVTAQVNAYRAASGFTPKTLVTVMAGMWDIQDHHAAVLAGSETVEAATQALQAAGAQLGATVNQITDGGRGGRVLYAPVPTFNLVATRGATQVGNSQALCKDVSTLLQQLTCEFNISFRLAVTNDGSHAGLVRADSQVTGMSDVTDNVYGILNSTTAACTTAPPNCTTATLRSDVMAGTTFTYLWADTLALGPSAQGQIGLLAEVVARNNPF